ncbi:efflux RND transporter permease subunit [Leeia sp.]|uniref:efflux RND transporter permease subunit n=1 Tax=Leeia sp. TaxID=2884678 RepID=UPI0035AF9C0D
MNLTRISIHNPVFACMMMLAILVLGVSSYKKLTVEQFPDVGSQVVIIVTNYPGATPEVVETDVTRRVEESMNTINGVDEISSTSYEGSSVVTVNFTLSTNMDDAMMDVRDKISVLTPRLRDGVDAPVIRRTNPDDRPIISLSLTSSSHSARQLTEMAENTLVKQLLTVPGVGQASVVGGVKRQIIIQPDPLRLQAANVGVDQLSAVLKRENGQLPVGVLSGGGRDLVVQLEGKIRDPQQFGELIVARRGDSVIRVRDVARVVDGQQEKNSLALINGKPAVAIDIYKVNKSNTVEVADAVKRMKDRLQEQLPTAMKLDVIADGSVPIRNSLNDVTTTLLEGALLTIMVVFLFLGSWRSTVITGLTLPISLLGTIFLLDLFGFSLNMMTLMALSLCIGLLIDDSIVVRENITRHMAMGKPSRLAALEGTQEITLAVLATTLTIVAVFLPVGYMGGIIGRWFHQFGITVTAAVLFSMFVSFTLDPMLSSVWRDPQVQDHKPMPLLGPLLGWIERQLERLSNGYTGLIRWALRHRLAVVGMSIGVLVLSFVLMGRLGSEFVPDADQSDMVLSAKTPVGSSLEYSRSKVEQVERILRSFREVERTYSTVNTGFVQGRNQFSIRIKLVPRKQRKLGQKELAQRFRARVLQVAGIELRSIGGANSAGGGGKPVSLSIQGGDIRELQRLADQLRSRMKQIPGLVDVESSLSDAKPMLALRIKRDVASDLGISLQQINQALQPLVVGDTVTTWESEDGENHDVVVRLDEANRKNPADLAQLRLQSSKTDPQTGQPLLVPLSAVVSFVDSKSPNQINRRSLLREIRLSANVDGRPAGEVGKDLQPVVQSMALPPGYRIVTGGANKDMQESAGYAAAALGLGVIFIYMVLASQFNSFLHPLAIMTALPLSLIGVVLGLMVGGSTMNIFSVIGIIMLMGLVTKNAILLVDFVEQAVRNGVDRMTAIQEAGRVRLRPILMTTFAMVLGMLPLGLGLGEGVEQRAPMAHAVIGGVITSTILTLVVVPVAYSLLDDFGDWLRRLTGRQKATEGHAQG